MRKRKTNRLGKRILSFTLAAAMVFTNSMFVPNRQSVVQAAETTITSMEYFSDVNGQQGPVINEEGTENVSFGFAAPFFNGGAATYTDVESDIGIKVKVGENYVELNEAGFIQNENWGTWFDNVYGYWFIVSETTEIQLYAKSNPEVTLEYTLELSEAVEDFTLSEGEATTTYEANGEGAIGLVLPKIGGKVPTEEQLANFVYEIEINGEWVDFTDAAKSGFVYNASDYDANSADAQWGYWYDTVHGIWMQPVTENYNFRVGYPEDGTLGGAVNDNYITYSLVGNAELGGGETSAYKLTKGEDTTTYTANEAGSIGLVLPKIGGAIPTEEQLENFVYEIKINDTWVDFTDAAKSGFVYTEGGYNAESSDVQWGYWEDTVRGIWMQVVTKDYEFRVGYPEDGTLGGDVNNNYITYSLVGNAELGGGETSAYKLTKGEDTTTYTANEAGSIGLVLPKIGGAIPTEEQLDIFVYEININDTWVDLKEFAQSGFEFSDSGYQSSSANKQWGYWEDTVRGIWFCPVAANYEFRVGYPENGIAGGAVNNNYITYSLVGNAQAPTPGEDFVVGDPSTTDLEGYNLVFNDEFSSNTLDTTTWNYDTGYFLNGDENIPGWGNNELQYYTDSTNNVFLQDGSLHIKALNEQKTFGSYQVQYSSGKLTTKDKFAFKYGRIDFRAKLPTGTGVWPALWMLPNNNEYGIWPYSGEIDVMEARGRLTQESTSALHFGGPGDSYIPATYSFPAGQSIAEYHIYSAVWEADYIKFYVDGNLFKTVTSAEWFSNANGAGERAPFDKEFYIIMNLALGGSFDGGLAPSAESIPAEMLVDYVRVYQAANSTDGTTIGSSSGPGGTPGESGTTTVAVTGVSLDQTTATVEEGKTVQLNATVAPANATNKNVTWKSSDETVAKVEAGLVTALKAGNATITVTTADGSKTATCAVTVTEQTGSADPVEPTRGAAYNATTKKLTFFVSDADPAVTEVKCAVQTYATEEEALTRAEDKTHTEMPSYALTLNKETGVWECTVENLNTAQPYVLYSFYFAGGSEAGIGEWTITTFADLTEKVGVTGITLNETSITLEEETSQTLTATVTPTDATDKSVTWKSSNDAIATVSSTGKVTAVAEGEATITAITTDGGYEANCAVTVTKKVIEATSVTLNKTSLTLEVGAEETLTATVNPDDAADKTITWKSGNTSIATVDANGKVSALKAGTTKITATTANGKTATCSLTVKISVTGVSLDQTSITLEEGATETLTATIAPENATNQSVTWTCDKTDIATVDAKGVVTAVKAGTATITATTADGSKTATCTVTVTKVAVTGVTLNTEALALKVGEDTTLTAMVAPTNAANQNVTFSCEETGVVSVDANGKVTALKAGTATITVTTEDGNKTATCVVTVTEPDPDEVLVESVSLDKETLTLTEGDEDVLTATINPEDATEKTVTWKSSNDTVAKVENGVVTALKAGEVTITVTTANGKTATCAVTVNARTVEVTSVTLDKETLELEEGATATLTATVTPDDATDKTVTWETSDDSIATVEEGVVTAIKAGNVTITAKAGECTASCNVTITAKETEDGENETVAVTGISLSKTTMNLEVGGTDNLTATIAPTEATNQNVTWKSLNEAVAKVDATGKVTAMKAGMATITVTTEDGSFTATCAVTVTAKVQEETKEDTTKVTGVALNKTALNLTEGASEILTATVNPSTAVNKQVVWTTSNEGVAKVDFTTGKVTAVKAGTATITVTTVDGGKTASCTVTVTAAPTVTPPTTTTPAPEGSKTEAEADKTVSSANTDKGDVAGSSFMKLRVKATGKNKQVKVSWKKVSGADGYIVYGAQCGKSLEKLTTTTKKSYTHKGLKKGKYYKYVVAAYKVVDGQKYIIETSTSVHAATTGTKFGNPTNITVKPAKATIKKGKKTTLKASFKGSTKQVSTHIAKFRYESSNPEIATVNKKGVVKGVAKGKATIYVYTQNGLYKTVKITVK